MDVQVFRYFGRLAGMCQVFPQCDHEVRIFFLVIEVKLHKPRVDQEAYLGILLFIQLQHLKQIIITVIINRRRILKLQAEMDGINGLPVEPGGILQMLVEVTDPGL